MTSSAVSALGQTVAVAMIGPALDVALSLTYFERAGDPQAFRLTKEFHLVYHRFLEKELFHYSAIRRQVKK